MPSINLGPMDGDVEGYDYDLDELPESPGQNERGLEAVDRLDEFYTIVEGKETIINNSRLYKLYNYENGRQVPDDMSCSTIS